MMIINGIYACLHVIFFIRIILKNSVFLHLSSVDVDQEKTRRNSLT